MGVSATPDERCGGSLGMHMRTLVSVRLACVGRSLEGLYAEGICQ
jgi:hypothetical protein